MTKENKWKPLSEATKGLIAKLRPKISDHTGGPNPVFGERKMATWRWNQRRFFVAYGHTSVSIVWVDDEGSCAKQHLTYTDGSTTGEWHQYEDAAGRVWAVRCPDRLDPKFKVRLEADIPPGHAGNRLREARANRKEGARKANMARVKQLDMD